MYDVCVSMCVCGMLVDVCVSSVLVRERVKRGTEVENGATDHSQL